MAEAREVYRKRGPYKKYMRYSNPYKFPAARRLPALNSSRQESDISSDEQESECDNYTSSCLNDQAADQPLLGEETRISTCENEMVMNSFNIETNDHQVCHDSDVSEVELPVELEDENGFDVFEDDIQTELFQNFAKDEETSSETFSSDEGNSEPDCESVGDHIDNNVNDNDLLFPGSPITTTSSIVLLLTFMGKHKLTREAFSDLLVIIEAHCPRPNNCKTTVKKLFDFLSQSKGDIVKHIFCGYCKAYHDSCQDKQGVGGRCKVCDGDLDKTHGFFIEVPLEKQLQNLFSNPEFVEGLKHRFQRVKKDNSNIEDVYDGSLYKKECKPSGFMSDPYNISVKLNTDGVSIFHSSQFGVWPLFLLVNELPPSLRQLSKYRIFAGLWYGEEKPFFSTFFKPFIDSLKEAEIHGIEVELPDGQKVMSKVKALSSHFDLPARAGVLEQVTYVGHDSCCFCYEHGEVIKTSARGHVMTFPFRDTNTGHAEVRTPRDVKTHSYIALEQDKTIFGFKAPSPLMQLPSFNVVNGIAIDSMHCVFLGVVKQLLGLWFNAKHSGEAWHCGNNIEKIDTRLLEIKPPSTISRVPRSIESHLKFWKATEYRNWLFYYSLPCMKGILSDEYHEHYALLVGGIFLLSSKSISPRQLDLAGKLLMHFVEMFDAFYAPRYVLMNHHLLLHLKKCVEDHGPLWCSSLFTFEDWNGDIGKYFHGTQNVASQIMTAVTCQQRIPTLVNEMPPGQARDITLRFQGCSERKNRIHLKDNFYAVGAIKSTSHLPFEDDLIVYLALETVSLVKYFKRLQMGAAIIHSKMYKRVSKRNTFTISYKHGENVCYGQIEAFFQGPVDCRSPLGAVIAPMKKTNQDVCKPHQLLGTPITHIVAIRQPDKHHFRIISLEDIVEVCIFMKFIDSDMGYAAHFPNNIEKD